MTMSNRRNKEVVLRAHPAGAPRDSDFECVESSMPEIEEGQFLLRNRYISLDAGFRQWMNEGAGDGYLEAMQLGEPVMGLVLGEVLESRNPEYSVGDLVMCRSRWEEFTVADGSDYINKLVADPGVSPSCYLGLLGPTGLTAYFGLRDIGKVQPGETVLISTAAGAVGSTAAQIAKIQGGRVVGMTSTEDKCRWLVDDLGLDGAINYRAEGGLEAGLDETCPDGVDVYFDNVGGKTLETVIGRLNVGARIVLSGALSTYNTTEPVAGPYNMFNLITQRATMAGFMVTDYVEQYPAALEELAGWLKEGRLQNVEDVAVGIENTGPAFCKMFAGGNRGKLVVRLTGDAA